MNVDARGKPIPCNFRLHNENAAKFVGLHHNYCGVNLSHSLRTSKTGYSTSDLVLPDYKEEEDDTKVAQENTHIKSEPDNEVEQTREIQHHTPLERFMNLDPHLQQMLKFKSVVDPETNDHIISELTEYKFMLYVLSDYDQSMIIDWHLEGEDRKSVV